MNDEEKNAIQGLKKAARFNRKVEEKLNQIRDIQHGSITSEEKAARVEKRRKEREERKARRKSKKKAGVAHKLWEIDDDYQKDVVLNDTGGEAPIPQNIDFSPLDPAKPTSTNPHNDKDSSAPIPANLDQTSLEMDLQALQEDDSATSEPVPIQIIASDPSSLEKRLQALQEDDSATSEPAPPGPTPLERRLQALQEDDSAPVPSNLDTAPLDPNLKQGPVYNSTAPIPANISKEPLFESTKPATLDPVENPFSSKTEDFSNPFETYSSNPHSDPAAVNPFDIVQNKMNASKHTKVTNSVQTNVNYMAGSNNTQVMNSTNTENSGISDASSTFEVKPMKLAEFDSSRYNNYSVPKIKRNERGIPIIVKPQSSNPPQKKKLPKLDFHV